MSDKGVGGVSVGEAERRSGSRLEQPCRGDEDAAPEPLGVCSTRVDRCAVSSTGGSMAPRLPHKVGDYEVLNELGRGGMGIVYRVRDARSSQLAAMKIIPPESLQRPEAALRFKREFRAMQRVRHPNVIRVFEAGTHDGCPYFTMELIEGRDIRSWLDGEEPIVRLGGGPPPSGTLSAEQRDRLNDPRRLRRLAEAIVQVGFALGAIHAHRIVHRDLKPDNILVSKAGVVKLMDFGIAKQLATSEHSSGGMVVGTFKYLSPEQALGSDIDGRADLYCLGVVLYELLAGRHPFYSENSVGYAYHHARKPPPPIERFNPEVDPGLKVVCQRLIEKDPNDRYPTAEDLIAAIREAVDDLAQERSQKQPPSPTSSAPYAVKNTLFTPALVGREAPLEELTRLVGRTREGLGGVLLLQGEKGLGKSRLVRELANRTRGRGVDVVMGRALREADGAYQHFTEVLDHLVDEAAQARPQEISRLLGAEGPILARYLPSLERLSEGRPLPAPGLDPAGERARFMAAASAFVERCARGKPRVIVLEDLHHADELSLELVRHLTEGLVGLGPVGESGQLLRSSLSYVLTVNPEMPLSPGARSLLDELDAAPSVQRVTLAPLEPAAVREMLATMIGGGDVADVLGDALHQETDGVPGLVEERIRTWAESGELKKQGREWVLIRPKAPPALPPPAGTRACEPEARPKAPRSDENDGEVVQLKAATRADIPVPDLAGRPADRRVGRLGKVARDVAERAAVAGERVQTALLSRVALRSEDELLDAIDELIKSDILVESSQGSEVRFAAADERDALLHGLSGERRKHLHALVANVLEDEGRRARRPANPEVLARHYLEAGEPRKALEQLMNAARRALEANATQTAAERVREAQELLVNELSGAALSADLARREMDLVLLRLDVLAAIGEHKECIGLARRRLPRLQGSVEARLVGEVCLRLAASERVIGELDSALEHVGEALRITERGGAHQLRCRAKNLSGALYEQRGQYAHSQRFFKDALELARAIGDEFEEENARAALTFRSLETGDLETAERSLGRLLDAAEARGERLRISRYVNALGIIAHERGGYAAAEAAYRRVIDLAKPSGDRRSVAIGLSNIAVVRRDEGRHAEALHLCAKAGRILNHLGDIESLSYLRVVEAQVLLDQGDAALALEKASEAVEVAGRASSATRGAEGRICRGLALARGGELTKSRVDVEAGLGMARATSANRVILWGLLAAAELERRTGEPEAAQRLIDEGLGRARRTSYLRFVERFEALMPEPIAL